MQLTARTVITVLSLGLVSTPNAGAGSPPSADEIHDLAEGLVRAYHAGDVDALRPHLAPGLVFRDPGLDQRLNLAGFLETVAKMGEGESDRELAVNWTGATRDFADVRGIWRWVDEESGDSKDLQFSIELQFEVADEGVQVVAWLDDFGRRARWKPARSDGQLETEHFRIVYFETEFSPEEAARLGRVLEQRYEETRRYLGRSFEDGYRLVINIAGGYESPYASDPGPRAFMLVPTRSAKIEYGFSLVHELTHNLMGLSWLSRHERQRNGVELYSGNRLLDEGFAVFVEEKLMGEGPEIFPNFGTETHAAYWQARERKDEPIWPVLEAEIHREHGNTRLAYLAQGSFCKFLVETYGLDRFQHLFANDLTSAKPIYGKDFTELEREWRELLDRFTSPARSPAGESPPQRR